MTGVELLTQDSILQFEELKQVRRERVRKHFRENVEFYDKRYDCCFKYNYKEQWFLDEVAAGGWTFRIVEGGVMIGLKEKCDNHSTDSEWFDWTSWFIGACSFACLFLFLMMIMGIEFRRMR